MMAASHPDGWKVVEEEDMTGPTYWQPIETAPKDGGYVVVRWGDDTSDYCASEAAWDVYCSWGDVGWRPRYHEADGSSLIDNPSHWTSLS